MGAPRAEHSKAPCAGRTPHSMEESAARAGKRRSSNDVDKSKTCDLAGNGNERCGTCRRWSGGGGVVVAAVAAVAAVVSRRLKRPITSRCRRSWLARRVRLLSLAVIYGFSPLVPPDKAPVSYPEACAASQDGGQVCVDAGYYFVQRVAKWQAPCFVSPAVTVDVLGRWGDNLAGDAKLKVGSPIRVEIVLWDGANVARDAGAQGYFVIKLEPAELDRLSDYGHLAREQGVDSDIPYTVGDALPEGTISVPSCLTRRPGSESSGWWTEFR